MGCPRHQKNVAMMPDQRVGRYGLNMAPKVWRKAPQQQRAMSLAARSDGSTNSPLSRPGEPARRWSRRVDSFRKIEPRAREAPGFDDTPLDCGPAPSLARRSSGRKKSSAATALSLAQCAVARLADVVRGSAGSLMTSALLSKYDREGPSRCRRQTRRISLAPRTLSTKTVARSRDLARTVGGTRRQRGTAYCGWVRAFGGSSQESSLSPAVAVVIKTRQLLLVATWTLYSIPQTLGRRVRGCAEVWDKLTSHLRLDGISKIGELFYMPNAFDTGADQRILLRRPTASAARARLIPNPGDGTQATGSDCGISGESRSPRPHQALPRRRKH